MRGILWKWLFTLGLIFWIALCVTDYYKKNIERHPEYLRDEYIEEETGIMIPLKREPPALTFWKTLSMVLSVSALVYIKRSSSNKKYTKTNLMLTYPNQDDYLHNLSPSPRLLKNVSVFPSNRIYCPDVKHNQISLEPHNKILGSNRKNIPGIVGVELVQKKLENLERSVANLKQRHHGSTSGIISGSPEFQKFLSKQSIKTSCSDLSVGSSCTSTRRKGAGSCLLSTTTTTATTTTSSLERKTTPPPPPPQMFSSSTSTTTINNANKQQQQQQQHDDSSTKLVPNNNKDMISVKLSSSKTEDSSWSTISEELSSSSNMNNNNSEVEAAVCSLPPPPSSTPPPLATIQESSSSPITEIYASQETFSATSKTSESIHSVQSLTATDTVDLLDYEDDSQVPGSNLVSTSGNTSVCSSTTLMSSSTNHVIPMFYDDSNSSFNIEHDVDDDDDDVLFNSLD